ncbi:MAG: translation initiation factor 2 [Tabrizicola sp.]|uniref:translation initiation factor 2 n=1 Tax=Tabrizicola sp. TaxID=2005166 RepID=UPI0027346078|nr:translation initiation factor 2 [Tabrizicola sp.]MDP3261354.1 translation initiation factor 2 [Tabrizicola sp.]MDP3649143.1 translation initiation factor 2 [Paracoccaceae bacterium]MDZ4069984.1 translation initiation factor 2 [Tabrizicola sp.]
MKPKFALDLTSDKIGLLHRAPKGWLAIGDVAFDAPDLTEALDYLRKTALGLSPTGISTKIVIPNGQILYTELSAPGPSREEKRKQIMAGLEGRTPYPVEDLVFDWSGKGTTVKVAVVARETLDEAEAFATQHRFNPVSFVAVPEAGNFVGEPWFGPTSIADTILAPGEAVDRDREPIALLHRDLPKTEPLPDHPVADAPQAPQPVAADSDDPLPGLEEAMSADLPPSEPAPLQPDEPDFADASIDQPDFEVLLAAEEAVLARRGAEPAPAMAEPQVEPRHEPDEAPFAHVTDSDLFPDPAGDLPSDKAAPLPDDEELPPAPSTAAMVAFASRRAAANAAAAATAPTAFGKPVEDLPPLGSASPVAPAAPAPTAKPLPAGLVRNSASRAPVGPITAPGLPGTRKAKGKGTAPPDLAGASANRPAMPGAKTLTKPGGTFGAKPQRGRPRFLGLFLTGLLLIFLALVAAWSSFYLSSADQTTSGTAIVDATLPEAEPGIEDEMLADMQDPETGMDPLPEAEAGASSAAQAQIGEGSGVAEALAADEGAPAIVDEAAAAAPAAEPVAEPVAAAAPEPAPEPAPDTALSTDVAAVSALADDQDEIFLAAMDAPPPALDALALPAPAASADAPPDAPMPPPAFGTVYRFDAQGLLMPTPDGILSPDGVMLIAGKPPLLPPSRSEVARAAASAATAVSAATPAATPSLLETAPGPDPATDAAATVPSPADPALQGFRPLPRPENLVPATEAQDDATLDAATAAEFAGLRPLARPTAVLAAAAAARPAASAAPADLGAQAPSLTAQNEATLAAAAAIEAENPSIVAISRRPALRPADMSRAVEAAVAAAVREPAPEEVASAAPQPEAKPEELDELNEPEVASAAPRIPTKANVAKQATFVNAINLSKMNLIGVYGSQSKRHALVRQANGRYKKVRVGDRIDGGTVQAITDNEVRYQKGGKLIALKMPKA